MESVTMLTVGARRVRPISSARLIAESSVCAVELPDVIRQHSWWFSDQTAAPAAPEVVSTDPSVNRWTADARDGW